MSAEAVAVLHGLASYTAARPGTGGLLPALRYLRRVYTARAWHGAIAYLAEVLARTGYGGALAIPALAAFDRDHGHRPDTLAAVITAATASALAEAP